MRRSVTVSIFLLPFIVTFLPAGGKQAPWKPDRDMTIVGGPTRTGQPSLITRHAAPAPLAYLLDESFEGAFPPAGWEIINPDGARTWAQSAAGNSSARMNFYDYDPNAGQIDSLLSPIVSGLAGSDSLSFDYAYCGFPYSTVGPDSVEVFLSTDGGATFPNLITVLSVADSTAPTNADSWSPSSSEWGSRKYPLPPGSVGGSVRLAFIAHNHYAQNFYLDNVRLGTRPAHDVAPASFDTPGDGSFVVETLPFTPQATFENLGSADELTPFTVTFEILDTAGTQVYASSRLLAPLNAGSTQAVSFDPVGSGLPAGEYLTLAITALASDEVATNDTITGQFTAEVRVSVFPYVQDFEGMTEAGWMSKKVSGSKNDWVRGTPAKPVQLRSAHSGANAWVTKLDTTYSNSQNAALYSPYFDLSGATTHTILEFYHNFRIESGWDAGVLEYTTNLGTNWRKVDTTLGRGSEFYTVKSRRWYNSADTRGNIVPPKWSDSTTAYATNDSGWIRSTTALGLFSGQANVRFRWRFRTDGSEADEGWAIDDVSVLEDSQRVVPMAVGAGWNMVSNPIRTSQDSVLQLFPTCLTPYLVGFGPGGPVQVYRVPNRIGFWGKFGGSSSYTIEGGAIDADSIPIVSGWNLVGSVSLPVDVASITSSPPGIMASSWFGYEGAYITVTRLDPGKAYWIKAYAPGVLILTGSLPALRPAD
jgi:hypothetical protein